ncbi:MAG: peptide chain release factor N(5)-glutamine methyltransferase [Propionibacteriaceae bacterium]
MDTRLPRHEYAILLEAVVGEQRARRSDLLSDDEQARLDELVIRRLAGEPLQHLTGLAWFRYETLSVGPGVFIPRPETELLAGWVVEKLHQRQEPGCVVELCAGSGAISAAIYREAPGHRQYAVEISADAFTWLAKNLQHTSVQLVAADMAEALTELDGTVDVVVVNPPYVPSGVCDELPIDVRDYDPHLALFSGADGLDAMHVVAQVAGRLLRSGGLLAAEHDESQHESVVELLADTNLFDQIVDNQDLTTRWRFVTAVRR